MTSISPLFGQLGWSTSQSAGQVAQPNGLWITSKTKRPVLYVFLLEILTLRRPVVALVSEVSTLRIADFPLARDDAADEMSETLVRFCAIEPSEST